MYRISVSPPATFARALDVNSAVRARMNSAASRGDRPSPTIDRIEALMASSPGCFPCFFPGTYASQTDSTRSSTVWVLGKVEVGVEAWEEEEEEVEGTVAPPIVESVARTVAQTVVVSVVCAMFCAM